MSAFQKVKESFVCPYPTLPQKGGADFQQGELVPEGTMVKIPEDQKARTIAAFIESPKGGKKPASE